MVIVVRVQLLRELAKYCVERKGDFSPEFTVEQLETAFLAWIKSPGRTWHAIVLCNSLFGSGAIIATAIAAITLHYAA